MTFGCIARASVIACLFVPIVSACSTGASGSASPAAREFVKIVRPLKADLHQLTSMIKTDDQNVADYTRFCLQASIDESGVVAALRAYAWPRRARPAARALAAAYAREVSFWQSMAATDQTVDDFDRDLNEFPRIDRQASALRADLGLRASTD